MSTTTIPERQSILEPVVVDITIAAEQIKELCAVLTECDVALTAALKSHRLDHNITQQLLDARIHIWEATNASRS